MNLIINLFGGGLCGQVIEKTNSTSNYRKGEEKNILIVHRTLHNMCLVADFRIGLYCMVYI
jgi:hypothetical protein